MEAQPPPDVPSAAPDNELRVTFPSVTGTDSSEDVVVAFTVFVPEDAAGGAPVLDPDSGAPAQIRDDGSVSGTFHPLDPRDSDQPFTYDANDANIDDHVLTARSIAVQKTANPLSVDGVVEPGGSIEYKLRVQVSDYFSMDPVRLVDTLGDGLNLDESVPQTFSVSEHDQVTTGSFTPGSDLLIDTSEHTCGDGTTGLTFDLSQALAAPSPGGGLCRRPAGRRPGRRDVRADRRGHHVPRDRARQTPLPTARW